MARLKRKGAVETFSVSVSPATKAMLRKAADRRYGGNLSALIEAIAVEAERQEALEWLLGRGPAVDEADYEAFMAEMTSAKRKRRRRPAA